MIKAGVAGLNFSEYMRQAAPKKEITEQVLPAIVTVASNLNQLTRLANSGK